MIFSDTPGNRRLKYGVENLLKVNTKVTTRTLFDAHSGIFTVNFGYSEHLIRDIDAEFSFKIPNCT